MKYRIYKFLSITLLFIATCAVTANAATVGIPSKPASQPATAAPSSTSTQTAPKVTPPVIPGLPKPNVVSRPTATDLITVANHIQVQAKSLNTLVTVAPGLVLTGPVTISIAYLSASPTAGMERKTQTYVSSSGNSFLYSDPEGDGKARKVHLDITLSEPKPGGGVDSSNLPRDLVLDPLYDVAISPLVFQLVIGCATIGANQIDLRWYAPDNFGNPQTVHFVTKEGETFSIREFSWARSEVSATNNLHELYWWYEETGLHCLPGLCFSPLPVPGGNLVPGKTYSSNFGLVRGAPPSDTCQATLDYTVTYQLRAYFGAPEVRDHR